MEDDKIKQKQVLVYNGPKKNSKPKIQYTIEVEPVVLDKRKRVTVNICDAAEKIEVYPDTIQKLVWRALHYKCEIETRQAGYLGTYKHCEKLMKYIEAFRHVQLTIIKMCKKRNFNPIIIEGGI